MPHRLSSGRAALYCAGILVSPLIIVLSPVAADTFEWNNPAGEQWDDPTSWTLVTGSGTAPPDVGDTAVFNLGDIYTVEFDFFFLSVTP